MSTTPKHVFTNHCIDWESMLTKADLDYMIDLIYKQSKTEEAKMRVDLANYKDYGPDQFCPTYVGMFVEWFAGYFLNYFGHNFNLENVQMLDVEGSSAQDCGVDGYARTVRNSENNLKVNFKSTGREVKQGSPVYIQVKGTKNRTKVFSPNDGSRLPNFMTHAQMLAMTNKKSYQARYVLFTTGEDIDYKLEAMTGKLMEVINYKIIKRHMKNNVIFLNVLREAAGLTLLPVVDSEPDQDAPLFEQEEIDQQLVNT